MARRRGKPGSYLMADDYTGFTTYNGNIQKDWWNNYVVKPLIRNLQEVASPLSDPYPVPIFRGGEYEQTTVCQFELQPLYIGKTNKRFPITNITQVLDLSPAIPDMEIGCTFQVY